jgi:hypothetical protein
METVWLSRRALRSASFLVALLLSLSGARAEPPGQLSEWLSLAELNAYLEKLDGEKIDGKNFWDRGNWLTAVEGRWEAGIPQYRISYDAVPAERRANWWQWFFNQDKTSFDQNVHRLADEGYTLVQSNSYVRPGGSERFQGVWHKLVPRKQAPLLPPGEYHLVERQGEEISGISAGITIIADRLVGHTPGFDFKGSLEDRYTGSIPRTPIQQPNERWMDPAWLKLMEDASWDEKDGKLRVVKNGKTVLRFEPGPPKVEAPSFIMPVPGQRVPVPSQTIKRRVIDGEIQPPQ